MSNYCHYSQQMKFVIRFRFYFCKNISMKARPSSLHKVVGVCAFCIFHHLKSLKERTVTIGTIRLCIFKSKPFQFRDIVRAWESF